MTPELMYLMFTALLTGVLWVPSVVGQVQSRGFLRPEDYVKLPTAPLSDWAIRANRAHQNAVENFSTFAAVVLVGHVCGVHTAITAGAAAVFFFARLGHAIVFLLGVKHVMACTLIFTVAWSAFIALAVETLRLGLAGPS